MQKKEKFNPELRSLADFARVISHPARLAILEYLAKTKTCISGDISNEIPLSRSTVSQHLKELREIGLIHGEIEGLKINYCLCESTIKHYNEMLNAFLSVLQKGSVGCCNTSSTLNIEDK